MQVQILWEDGFNQVAPFELLRELPRLTSSELELRRQQQAVSSQAARGGDGELEQSAAERILAGARAR